ncbi:MAG: arylsulfatase [Pirellulaceae bacterium]
MQLILWTWLSLISLVGLENETPIALSSSNESAPNVVVILADDLGFSDLGCYGGEIQTPNLNQLAETGIRFTQFYNTGRCWPTRASLLTGYYPHQVGFDVVPGEPPIKRHDRPDWAPLISEQLQKAGYRCYHSGKWHLDSSPTNTGFDRSYRLDDHGRFFSPKRHFLDDKPLPSVERESGYYATTEIANRAIEFLDQHQREHSGKPFFEFVAFTSPHFPLHAKPQDIAQYRGRYSDGWNVLRDERWKRQQQLGLFQNGSLSEVEMEVGPPYDRPDDIRALGPGEINRPLPWNELTAEQQEFQSQKMEVHAAMVHRMDFEVGRIVSKLQESGQFENTLLVFLSDNGASAEIMIRDDGHDPQAVPGSPDTHLCLGPGFSNAANTPFRRHKTWVHEGGIHTPFIVHWPAGIEQASRLESSVGHVIDIFPTLAEAAGGTVDSTNSPIRPGRSLLKTIKNGQTIEREYLWWTHEGNSAIRVEDWKLVKAKDSDWELFNLTNDPTETNNLILSQAEKASELKSIWFAKRDEFRIDNQRFNK